MNTEDPFWKSISFGFKGIWLTCLGALFYTTIFRLDIPAFIFWFTAAAIYSMQRRMDKEEVLEGRSCIAKG